ncbi:MAG: tetratricopeptide repeat protein [Asgard group archaeon]|nr:tetratricopeptide repeat protein [Asgard group archaeon]
MINNGVVLITKKGFKEINDPELLLSLASEFLEKDEFESAKECFELALSHETDEKKQQIISLLMQQLAVGKSLLGNRAGFLNNLAVKQYADGQTDLALLLLERIVAEFPDNFSAWLNLGTFYCETGQPAKALYPYQKALELESTKATVWYYLAIAYGDLLQFEDALENSFMALVLDPLNKKIWSNHGYLLQSKNITITKEIFDDIKSKILKKREELGLQFIEIP